MRSSSLEGMVYLSLPDSWVRCLRTLAALLAAIAQLSPNLLLSLSPCCPYLKPPLCYPPELWQKTIYQVAWDASLWLSPWSCPSNKQENGSSRHNLTIWSEVPKVLQGFSEKSFSCNTSGGGKALTSTFLPDSHSFHFSVISPVTWDHISYFHLWNYIFKCTSFQSWWKMTPSSMKHSK